MANREPFSAAKQKLQRQNSTLNLHTGTPALISPLGKAPDYGTPIDVDDDGIGFTKIIAAIMRGFGDCEKPLDESVQLVEHIVLHQLNGILSDVSESSLNRKGKVEPSLRDFEFLMRKNPTKVFRLQKHMRDLQKLKRKKKEEMFLGRPWPMYEDELDTNGAESDDDPDRDVEELYDEEKIRRVFRADRISQPLSGNQYLKYYEMRRSSFYCHNSNKIRIKLRRWLKTDIVMSNQVYTILAYLAHETIATIVDYAILTRLHSANRLHEPFNRLISSRTSYTMLHMCPEVTQGRGQDGIKPISVQEIHEAMRRHAMGATRTLGMHRNMASNRSCPYLAL